MVEFTPHSIPYETGWIEVIAGCMFSGKTEELIRRLRRAQIAKLDVKVFKPFIDQRYSINEIVSHSEQSLPSILINLIVNFHHKHICFLYMIFPFLLYNTPYKDYSYLQCHQ